MSGLEIEVRVSDDDAVTAFAQLCEKHGWEWVVNGPSISVAVPIEVARAFIAAAMDFEGTSQ